MTDYVDQMIDFIYKHKPEEKEMVKRIRNLVLKLEKLCTEDGDFNVILNALDLMKEYYVKQVEVLKETNEEKQTNHNYDYQTFTNNYYSITGI